MSILEQHLRLISEISVKFPWLFCTSHQLVVLTELNKLYHRMWLQKQIFSGEIHCFLAVFFFSGKLTENSYGTHYRLLQSVWKVGICCKTSWYDGIWCFPTSEISVKFQGKLIEKKIFLSSKNWKKNLIHNQTIFVIIWPSYIFLWFFQVSFILHEKKS